MKYDPAATLRANRANPEREARRIEGLRRHAAENREYRAELLRLALDQPGVKERQLEGLRRYGKDPEARAKRSAATKLQRAKRKIADQRRAFAKQIVADAGLMPLRETVDFAVRLLDSGAHPHVVSISLKRAA